METVKLSVIIPVYNTGKYLQACIDCLMSQTIQETEYIFVNDASTDDSLMVLKENEKNHPGKITVIDSPENLRQGGARNIGLRSAKGKYIGFCDSDDLIRPDTYEKLYDAIIRYDTDAAFSWMLEVPEDITLEEALQIDPEEKRPEWTDYVREISGKELTDEDRMNLMCLKIGGSVTWLYRKDFLIDNELFFPERLKYEDNGWSPLVMAMLSKVYFVDNMCYFYRQNSASTTQSKNSPGVYDRITVEENLLKDFKKRGLFERFYPAIEYCYITRRTFMTYGFFMYTYDDPPKEDMRELMSSLKRTFPKWRKNRFYHKYLSGASRFKDCIKYFFPISYCNIIRMKR